MKRAYSFLEIKSLDAEQRIISGIATSASTDRMGDIVEPDGAQFTLPIPLLWQHDSKQPIGEVFAAKATKAGIEIQARIAQTDVPGQLKDRLDMAWQSISLKLVRGLSIGFQSLEDAYDKTTGGIHFLQWLWLELSAVTIPANQDASIQTIKSLDVWHGKGVVPPNICAVLAPKDEAWAGPTLSDFTAKAWGDLTDAEKRHIAGHFAWAAADPPAAFGDLKLGHHDPKDGDVVWHGVVAAAGRLNQTSLPSADVAAVKAHLAHHYQQFKETPPWEAPKSVAAASGKSASSHQPGVSGLTRVVSMRLDRPMKKSYAEQIAGFESTRAAKTAKMDSILEKSAEAGVTLDAAEKEEHDTLVAEVTEIDEHLTRLRAAEDREKKAAKPVAGGTPDEGGRSRVPQRITVDKVLPPGIAFARFAMCVAASKGSRMDSMDLAKTFYPDDSQLHSSLRVKAAIGAGAATTSHWADDLVPYNILMNDFIEFLRPGSILGKFGGPNPGGGPDYPSLRKVPFNVRVSGASAGLTAHWIGEGLPAAASKMTTFNTALTWAKVEALAILTQEEIRFSNPSAEQKVRDDIGRAVNARLDIDFVDPALAAVNNVSPASITYGVAATAPTNTTAAAFRTDLATAIALFASNNLDPSDITLIMSAQMALQLSMMVNTLGNNDFPDINMKGGMLRGFPVIVSEHLTAVGSPSTQTIVAVKASDVYLADDGVVTVDASGEASLEMLDSALVQDGTAGTGTSLVSLWQNGLLGLKAQREITWKLRRSTAVQYISPAAYKA